MKKIKKAVPIRPVKNCSKPDDLLSFIKTDKKKQTRAKNGERVKIDRSAPSKYPSLTHWKNKEIDKWISNDFIGFYLFVYNEVVGEEDITFAGRKADDTMGKEKGCLNRCLKNFFLENNNEMKNYIEYIIRWWISPDSFPDSLPSFWSIFGTNGTFVKQYRSTKIIKKKSLKSRKEIDNHYADKQAWDNYFDKED
ncbi:MAG: hypothetical protein K0Q47_143 [Sedimentibacter sp.]|nr:hypothetical protein [Sedimentibacter sp.]